MHLAYLHYLCDGASGLNHVRQFATAAQALGHELDVYAMNLAPRDASGSAGSSAAWTLREGLKKRFGRYLHEPKELYWNIRYARRETKLLQSKRPDVLLVRNHLLTASCVWVARRLELPLVIELNAPAAESRLYWDEYSHVPLVPEWLEAWKLRRADSVTVVSTALKNHVIDQYSLSESKLTVVPNGADVATFHPDAAPDPEVSSQLADATVVGFVGSFQKFHGSDLLGRMAQQLGSARTDVAFLFVGEGPEVHALRQQTKSLGGRIIFTGGVQHSRIPGLVACMDIGVMPQSNFYGSPLKVLEWMAAGKAVVAPRYGPLEEIMEDGVEGLLFPPEDHAALIDCVTRLAERPDLARSLGQAAAARVRSSLTWEHNASRVLQACQQAHRGYRRVERSASLAE